MSLDDHQHASTPPGACHICHELHEKMATCTRCGHECCNDGWCAQAHPSGEMICDHCNNADQPRARLPTPRGYASAAELNDRKEKANP